MSVLGTYTGRLVSVEHPSPSDIAIEDIAHALALMCRFNGHVSSFYSVAQHSVMVSHQVPARDALAGLLHDAAEAYVGDLIRPVKRRNAQFMALEARFWLAIVQRFDLPSALPESVIEADHRMCATEYRDLMTAPPSLPDGTALFLADPYPGEVVPVGPDVAKRLFLGRYRDLTQGGHSPTLGLVQGGGEGR